jgi:hypothetical protein
MGRVGEGRGRPLRRAVGASAGDRRGGNSITTRGTAQVVGRFLNRYVPTPINSGAGRLLLGQRFGVVCVVTGANLHEGAPP